MAALDVQLRLQIRRDQLVPARLSSAERSGSMANLASPTHCLSVGPPAVWTPSSEAQQTRVVFDGDAPTFAAALIFGSATGSGLHSSPSSMHMHYVVPVPRSAQCES